MFLLFGRCCLLACLCCQHIKMKFFFFFSFYSFSVGYLCLPNGDKSEEKTISSRLQYAQLRKITIHNIIATKEKKTFCLLLLTYSRLPFRKLPTCRQNKILQSFSCIRQQVSTYIQYTYIVHIVYLM